MTDPWRRSATVLFVLLCCSQLGIVVFTLWEPPFEGSFDLGETVDRVGAYWPMNALLGGPSYALCFVTAAARGGGADPRQGGEAPLGCPDELPRDGSAPPDWGLVAVPYRLIARIVVFMLAAVAWPLGPATAAPPPVGSTTAVAWGSHPDVPDAARSEVRAVSAGHAHVLALKTNGTVVAWGSAGHGQTSVPAGLTGVTAVAAGWLHSLALKADGTVVAWGDAGYAYVPEGLSDVVAIAARKHSSYSMALRSDGTVVAWGTYADDLPAGLTGIRAISGGGDHSLALKEDGTVVGWGSNGHGQLDIPAGLSGVRAVAAGSYGSLALKQDGTVVSWGSTHGLPAGLRGVRAIASGGVGDLALLTDGTVVASRGWSLPTPPPGLTDVRAISVGSYDAVAIAPTTAPPGPVTGLVARPGDGRVALSWTDPDEPDLRYTRLLRSETGFADGPEPTGDQVVLTYTRAGRFADENALNGTTYFYTAFARDATGGWSTRATVSATPEERTAPQVVRVRPDPDAGPVARDRNLVSFFTEALDPASVNARNVYLQSDETGARVPATVTYEEGSTRVVLDPVDLLDAGGTYTAWLGTGLRDVAGNRLSVESVWGIVVSSDGTAPGVTATSPAAGATGVDPAAVVTATFDEELRNRSLTATTVSLRPVGGAALEAAVSHDPATGVVSLDPAAALAPGTTYVVRLSRGVRDLAGNRLAEPLVWWFRTA